MKKLTVALGNFAKALLKKGVKIHGLWVKVSSLLLPIDRQYFELPTAWGKQLRNVEYCLPTYSASYPTIIKSSRKLL